MHDDVRCSRDERKKPNTICFYDKTKCGVDVADVVIGKYTTKYKTRRWTMNAFAYMLDTARTNAHTVFKEIKHDIRTFDFIWQLGMLLVNTHITRRSANNVGLQQTVITKMCKVLKVAESLKQQTLECKMLVTEISVTFALKKCKNRKSIKK